MKQASELRKELSKMDLDPGYFCKFVKDQFVRHTIKEKGLRDIVDIGCDTAYMAGLLNHDNYDFRYIGLDINENFNEEYMRGPLQYCVKTNNLLTYLTFSCHNPDCFLLLDVIEHFSSPEAGWDVLDLCADKLRPGGFLFVSTPNQLGDKPNWPEYHQYEYKIENLYSFSRRRKDLQCYTYFGWSMSDSEFDKIIELQKYRTFSQYYYEDMLPKPIARVFGAISNPNQSRDVMFVWRKK